MIQKGTFVPLAPHDESALNCLLAHGRHELFFLRLWPSLPSARIAHREGRQMLDRTDAGLGS
jgi:hypothetical protein